MCVPDGDAVLRAHDPDPRPFRSAQGTGSIAAAWGAGERSSRSFGATSSALPRGVRDGSSRSSSPGVSTSIYGTNKHVVWVAFAAWLSFLVALPGFVVRAVRGTILAAGVVGVPLVALSADAWRVHRLDVSTTRSGIFVASGYTADASSSWALGLVTLARPCTSLAIVPRHVVVPLRVAGRLVVPIRSRSLARRQGPVAAMTVRPTMR